MRSPVVAVALVATLAITPAVLNGCDHDSSSEDPEEERLGVEPATPPIPPGASAEERVIRRWVAAVNAGNFERAADFFTRDAVVEQLTEFRLRGRADAIRFNSELPCRADLTDVEDEGSTTLGAFRLRAGRRPGTGRCEGGTARVRFRIRGGKFVEWRQLTDPPVPQDQVA
jgi:hypothetical protein